MKQEKLNREYLFIVVMGKGKSILFVYSKGHDLSISRSPAIVLAYLMRTYQVSLEQCLIHVIKARPCVLPNDGFLKQLILYDRLLVEHRRKKQTKEPTEQSIQIIPIQVEDKPKTPSPQPQIERSPVKTRQSLYHTEIVKRPVTRSHSAYTRSDRNTKQERWSVTRYYPANFHLANEKQQPVKFITEIYDRATNRYIRAN